MIKYKKIGCDVKKYFPQMAEVFSKEPVVSALYLFGSYGRDSVSPLSDVDVAVLLNTKVIDYTNLRFRLLSSAMHILQTEEIDLVILNTSPSYLQYRVIKDGKLLFAKDKVAEQRFRERAVSLYLDTKRIRDEYFAYLVKDFLQGEVGYGYRSREYQSALKRAQGLYR